MSVHAALDFMERLHEDEDLCAAVKRVPRGKLGNLRNVAADAGFVFDDHDYKTAVEILTSALSDDELEGVVGGLNVQGSLSVPRITLPTVLHSSF